MEELSYEDLLNELLDREEALAELLEAWTK